MLEDYVINGDRLLVSSTEVKEEKTAGGLIIPTSNKEDSLVVLLNVEKTSKSLEKEFSKDDKVMVFRNRGTSITIEGKDYKLIEKQEVLITKIV